MATRYTLYALNNTRMMVCMAHDGAGRKASQVRYLLGRASVLMHGVLLACCVHNSVGGVSFGAPSVAHLG